MEEQEGPRNNVIVKNFFTLGYLYDFHISSLSHRPFLGRQTINKECLTLR